MAESKKIGNDKVKEKEAKEKIVEEKEKIWATLSEEEKEGLAKEELSKALAKSKDKKEDIKRGDSLGIGPKHLLVIVGVALLMAIIVCKFMIPFLAPTLASYNAKMGEIASSFSSVNGRIDGVEDSIPDVNDFVSSSLFNQEIDELVSLIASVNTSVEQKILDTQSSINSSIKESTEYNLTGVLGNYTLAVRSREGGNYTAKLNFLYTPAASIGTVNSTLEEVKIIFYSNWTTSLDRNYIPSMVYDSQWKVSDVFFYTGKFSLESGNWTNVSIVFSGLNITPNLVFAEVFKVV